LFRTKELHQGNGFVAKLQTQRVARLSAEGLHMKVRVLGSGTIVGSTGRNCSGYLVDDRILVDCGPGIWGALYKSPGRRLPVDTVLLSHLHLDHVADLIPLLFARYVTEAGKEQAFSVYSSAGTRARLGRLLAPHRRWLREVSYALHELRTTAARVGEYTVRSLPTGHTAESVCFRITDRAGVSLFYSGDATWSDGIVELARSCELAIVEAAQPSDRPAPDHLTPRLAGRLAAQASVKTLLLAHCYPQVLEGDPVAEAAASFSGKVILAQDGTDLVV
jgi:ribonuclease BN (tRNA processing enzyme)